MEAQKKVWTKPVLIVIGRGEPEERVLSVCKIPVEGGTGNVKNCNASNPCLSFVKS